MKKILSIMTLIIVCLSLNAFSGHITQNTVWDNDIIITGDVWIDTDITLTIEPGVTVSFLKIDVANDGIGDIDFIVNGRLDVNGTEINPVTFTSWETNPQPGDWKGITHDNPTSVYSTIDCAVIEYAYDGITEEGKYLSLTDVTIKNCGNIGIIANDSVSGQLSLTDVIIKNCDDDGIYAASNAIILADGLFSSNNGSDGFDVNGDATITVSNSRLVSNQECGLNVTNSDFTLLNSSISYNDEKGISLTETGSGSTGTITDCDINDNSIFGIYINGVYDGTTDSSVITGNGNSGILLMNETSMAFNSCSIHDNGGNPTSYLFVEDIPTSQLYSAGGYSSYYSTLLPINLITRIHASGYADHNGSSDDYYFRAYDTNSNNFWSYTRTNTSTDTNYDAWFNIDSSLTTSNIRVLCGGYSIYSYSGRIEEIEYDIGSLNYQSINLNYTASVDLTGNWWGTTDNIQDELYTLTNGLSDYTGAQTTEPVAGATLVNLAPQVTVLTPDTLILNPSTVEITWSDYDIDDDAVITLGYTPVNTDAGVTIVSTIREDSTTDSYTWDVSEVPYGLYYISAVIDDGVNPVVTAYSSEQVMVGPVTAKVADTYGESANQVMVPVNITNAHDRFGFISWQFSLVYDPTLLVATGIEIDGTLSESWSVNYNNSIPGQIDVNGYSATNLSEDGNLIYVLFNVHSGENDFITGNMGFSSFVFNDADIPVTQQSGVFTVRNKYSLSGSVSYYNENAPIQGVDVSIEGIESGSVSTLNDGSFAFDPLYAGDYSFSLSKDDQLPFLTVTPYDASITAQYALNTWAFNSSQIIAGDVSGNDVTDAYDAAMMVQYAINLIDSFPAGNWMFTPEDVSITLSSPHSRDFTAIAIGDPSGNYPNTVTRTLPIQEIVPLITDRNGVRLDVYCEDNFSSTGMKLRYNPEELQYVEVVSNLADMPVMVNAGTEGELYLGGFSVTELNTNDAVYSIRFNNVGHQEESDVTVDYLMFDEVFTGSLIPTSVEGEVNQINSTVLDSNYPNPFNPETTLSFNLKERSATELKIYNQRGQLVTTLVNDVLNAGQHSYVWKGVDSEGRRVASGVYFYKLHAGPYTRTRKMILMK